MIDDPAVKTLVLGVGNLLMMDEGVGVHVIERLAAGYDIPEEVRILDGGTLGLDLLYYLEGIENLLMIDAVETGRESGFLLRMEDDQVPSFLSMKLSPHQIGIPDMLYAARLKGITPHNMVLIGIQPKVIALGLDLSPVIQDRLPSLVDEVIDQLVRWGHRLPLRQ